MIPFEISPTKIKNRNANKRSRNPRNVCKKIINTTRKIYEKYSAKKTTKPPVKADRPAKPCKKLNKVKSNSINEKIAEPRRSYSKRKTKLPVLEKA